MRIGYLSALRRDQDKRLIPWHLSYLVLEVGLPGGIKLGEQSGSPMPFPNMPLVESAFNHRQWQWRI